MFARAAEVLRDFVQLKMCFPEIRHARVGPTASLLEPEHCNLARGSTGAIYQLYHGSPEALPDTFKKSYQWLG